NDVSDIDLGQRLAAAGQVAGAEQLKVVRRRVAGEAQVLLPLAQDLMNNGSRNAVAAEAADREIIAGMYEVAHRLAHGPDLVGQGARLGGKALPGVVRRRVGEQGAFATGEGFHFRWPIFDFRLPAGCSIPPIGNRKSKIENGSAVLVFAEQLPEPRVVADRVE